VLFGRVYDIVALMPRDHLLTTIALLRFLAKVATHSQANLMTTKNLALVCIDQPYLFFFSSFFFVFPSPSGSAFSSHVQVVGPNVIRPAEQSFAGVAEQQLSNTPKVTTIVTLLIEKWALLESRLQVGVSTSFST
jgi:hypothetical protein